MDLAHQYEKECKSECWVSENLMEVKIIYEQTLVKTHTDPFELLQEVAAYLQ